MDHCQGDRSESLFLLFYKVLYKVLYKQKKTKTTTRLSFAMEQNKIEKDRAIWGRFEEKESLSQKLLLKLVGSCSLIQGTSYPNNNNTTGSHAVVLHTSGTPLDARNSNDWQRHARDLIWREISSLIPCWSIVAHRLIHIGFPWCSRFAALCWMIVEFLLCFECELHHSRCLPIAPFLSSNPGGNLASGVSPNFLWIAEHQHWHHVVLQRVFLVSQVAHMTYIAQKQFLLEIHTS